jgi:hypothetical protein
LKVLLPFCLSLGFVVERGLDIEPVVVRALVDFGFEGFLIVEVEGRGGLNAFGGIVILVGREEG